jgi:hypothetical protein
VARQTSTLCDLRLAAFVAFDQRVRLGSFCGLSKLRLWASGKALVAED